MNILRLLFRGWPGKRCPECKARPLHKHKPECSIGKWDGGIWA